jgi:large subunit ribosomal protein L35
MAPNAKAKTHKGLKKRIKISGTGKVLRGRAGAGHLLSGKSSKRRRKLRQTATVPAHMAKFLIRQLTS